VVGNSEAWRGVVNVGIHIAFLHGDGVRSLLFFIGSSHLPGWKSTWDRVFCLHMRFEASISELLGVNGHEDWQNGTSNNHKLKNLNTMKQDHCSKV